jgi:hypothetical protein
MIRKIALSFLFFYSIATQAQAPTFDEMNFDLDSSSTAYKPAKNYVFTKSKKGSGAMVKVNTIDSIANFPVNEIVLVFSETSPEDINDRETSNQERWENLLKTYPAIFQFSTVFKNHCQSNFKGDTAGFKAKQGFYIYYTPPAPKKVEPVVVAKVEEVKKTTEPLKEEKKKSEPEEKKKPIKEEKVKEEKIKEEPKKTNETKKEEKPDKNKKEETNKKDDDGGELVEGPETTTEISEADFKPKKKAGYSKPRKAKDPKACRTACYGNNDEDLINFFVTNVTLTKKQRRHAGKVGSMVRLQLNFDGNIKKAMVTGTNTELNELVTNAIKQMDLWNPTVKNGITVKSEVRFTLKYNKEKKGLVPEEMTINPRLAPKCKCVPDSEIFPD